MDGLGAKAKTPDLRVSIVTLAKEPSIKDVGMQENDVEVRHAAAVTLETALWGIEVRVIRSGVGDV